MTREELNERIERAFDDPRSIQAAIAKGVADARKKYAQAGCPMSTWKNGKVVWVDPMTGVEVPEAPRIPNRPV